MSNTETNRIAGLRRAELSFEEGLRLAGDFFMERGPVYETMRRLAQRLEEEGIAYAVIGGMALAAHGYARLTLDVDILLNREGLERFQKRLVGRGYVPAFTAAKKSFVDIESKIRIEILTAGEFPGDGLPKPVAFPDPARHSVDRLNVRIIQLQSLVELKLASGLSAPHRLRDLADVQDLILHLNLPLEFENDLDSSVRPEYRRLWEMAQKGRQQQE
ncbi:MAG: nucleotidyltransferase family protein [Acidobacteria bacterium]|nr:nucleotidyltransferase family protein [Acidobacteriota bacterium]